MRIVKGKTGALFDCPEDMVRKALNTEFKRGITLELATELPELEEQAVGP